MDAFLPYFLPSLLHSFFLSFFLSFPPSFLPSLPLSFIFLCLVPVFPSIQPPTFPSSTLQPFSQQATPTAVTVCVCVYVCVCVCVCCVCRVYERKGADQWEPLELTTVELNRPAGWLVKPAALRDPSPSVCVCVCVCVCACA